jgi:hypothetical protein
MGLCLIYEILEKKSLRKGGFFCSNKFGAADQIRTDDLLHGKQTLYQLSYNRI